MRLFNTLCCVLNTWVVCSSLKYCDWVVQSMCMLNKCIVYVNICIFLYNIVWFDVVYMNSVSVLYWNKSHPEHIHTSQAKLFRSSLPYTYEQPNNHKSSYQINNNCKVAWLCVWMFVWLHHTVYVRHMHNNLEKPRNVRIFTHK